MDGLNWATDATPYSLERAGADWCFRLPDGRLACSARDPRGEAERRCRGVAAGSRPVLLGLGAGHDLDVLLDRGVVEVLVVEADPRSLATARERWRRLGRALPDPRRCRAALASGDAELAGVLGELLAAEHGERPLLPHPWCAELWRGTAPLAAGVVEDLRRRRAAARGQEEEMAANRAANAGRLREAGDVARQDGCWGDAPVAVCGAGPSLAAAREELGVLAAAGGRLVAVSTALPVLAAWGLAAHAAVATDPSPLLAADLTEGAAWRQVPLVVFPGSCRGLVAAWPGPLWLALPQGPGLRETEWEGHRPGGLPAGLGTVAGPALALAARLSRGPLLLAGVDLGGADHVAGVRRPATLPRPDFAFARRGMRGLVGALRRAGRRVGALGPWPDWLPAGEE